jgi:hypothetical protein
MPQVRIGLETPEHAPYDKANGMPEADVINHDAYNKYISGRVYLPHPQGIVKAAVEKKRK